MSKSIDYDYYINLLDVFISDILFLKRIKFFKPAR